MPTAPLEVRRTAAGRSERSAGAQALVGRCVWEGDRWFHLGLFSGLSEFPQNIDVILYIFIYVYTSRLCSWGTKRAYRDPEKGYHWARENMTFPPKQNEATLLRHCSGG